MKNSILISAILFLFLFSISCGNKVKKQEQKQKQKSDSTATIVTAQASIIKKYGIKSGIIHFETTNNLSNIKIENIVYFDDYGAKEAKETYVNGVLNDKVVNKNDGWLYQINLKQKSGRKSESAGESGTEIKFNSGEFWTPEQKKVQKFNIGHGETVCGKECNVFTTDDGNIKSKFAGWKGITMLLETSTYNGKMKFTTSNKAVKIEENVFIPKKAFEIPVDINMYQ